MNAAVLIAVMAIVTMILRFLPFIVFNKNISIFFYKIFSFF